VLILKRKVGEQIIIRVPDGPEISIVITDIEPRKAVRVGVKAPRNVSVHRGEVQRQIDGGHYYSPETKP
jgi:carbon storage regulator